MPYDGPYFIDKVPNGVKHVKTKDDWILKQKQNGCNVKKFHDRQENEVKKKILMKQKFRLACKMGRKMNGKKMNQKQKKFLEGQDNETNNRDDNGAETQDSKQLDGTQNDSRFMRVSDEQGSDAHKSDDRTYE